VVEADQKPRGKKRRESSGEEEEEEEGDDDKEEQEPATTIGASEIMCATPTGGGAWPWSLASASAARQSSATSARSLAPTQRLA